MNRTRALTGKKYDNLQPNFYVRRRPKYYDSPLSSIMNVKSLGAKGDGVTDDTAVLNAILNAAANTSCIVHFPHGVYRVTDTLHIPIGSRIVGQAWSQIMGSGARFADEGAPRVVVRVGYPGDVGIIEIQDMLFTVSGATAGAIILQWNAQEATQGSVGMWDTHIRVGGAAGSNLRASDCPKQTAGAVRSQCKAAFLMAWLMPGSTTYLENVWAWVADHDLDTPDRKQVNVYAGRGMLIESRLAYLWATSVEHATLYQYQINNAQNLLISTLQSETPYFQPLLDTAQPYRAGSFPGDPSFDDCAAGDKRCHMAWGARIIDSKTIYMLSAGIYSWFSNYDQTCTSTNDCQQKAVWVEQSSDIWLYNLCTAAVVELISPFNQQPTLAANNRMGRLSSVVAWFRGVDTTSGPRDFPGFRVREPAEVEIMLASDVCKSALTSIVKCHTEVDKFQSMGYRGSLDNATLTGLVCQSSCGDSLASWVSNVQQSCTADATGGNDPSLEGARMYAGWNETCLLDPATGRTCNEVIDRFTSTKSIQDMPRAELCSYCHVERMAMMQRTPYSTYDGFWKSQLDYIYETCSISRPTDVKVPQLNIPVRDLEENFCLTETWYTTQREGETCEDIASSQKTSSAALFLANQARIISCTAGETIPQGTKLCIPPSCDRTYRLQSNDSCASIERSQTQTSALLEGDVARYNSWVGFECSMLQNVSLSYGTVICLGPLLGAHNTSLPDRDPTTPSPNDGYSSEAVPAPEGARVAEGTTHHCGKWHEAIMPEESCTALCMRYEIDAELFLRTNPSLGTSFEGCTANLVNGTTYCVSPYRDWEAFD
jgi:hypothetical protein